MSPSCAPARCGRLAPGQAVDHSPGDPVAPTASSRRSAAAARRRLLELRAADRHAAAALPPHLSELLERFRPQGAIAAQWPDLQRTVAEVLGRSRITGVDSFRKHITHV